MEGSPGCGSCRQLSTPRSKDVAQVAEAAGLEPVDLHPEFRPQVVSTGLRHLVTPLRDLETLRRAARNADALVRLARAIDLDALYLFALTEEGATARMFDPEMGIGEDPATGSAAGPLGAYLASRGVGGMPGTLAIRQGEQVGRPSVLHVEVRREGDSWRVLVGGGVAIVGQGQFDFEGA